MKRPKLFPKLLSSLPLALIDLVLAQSPLTPIPLPSLDLSSFGQLSLGGDFTGVSLYQYTGQTAINASVANNGVYIQLPNGALGQLGTAQGTISSLCTLDTGLFIGGNFSGINGITAPNIASYNFSTLQFSKLNDRDILGTVNSLYCDQTNNLVYVGGDFQSGGSNNAIVWNQNLGHWQDLPFGGFDGPVNDITTGTNGDILFGGVFDALGNGTGVPKDGQVINIVTANVSPSLIKLTQVTTDGTTTTTANSDPSVLFCNNGSSNGSWLLEDRTAGSLTVLGDFGYRPTKLRLRNTHLTNRGTKTWRFVANPIDGIMNFTYTDPSTGQTRACDATCPLSNDTTLLYQDFEFVNVIGMNGFTIFISDWYGDGGGLSGVELFQDDIVAYAVNTFNEPSCLVGSLGSESSTTGSQFTVESSFPETSASYLSSNTGGNVTMAPNILSSRNYSIRLFTPGCIPDGTCSTRGIVLVQNYFAPDEPPQEQLIYQTNNYDKYDTIYQGRVDALSSSFRPRVVISPAQGQPSTQNIVAQKVQYNSLSPNGDVTSSPTSSGSLNGLYDYAPGNWTGDMTAANATYTAGFDVAGTKLEFDANINEIVSVNGRTFVAGSFISLTLNLENVMVVDEDGSTGTLESGGLNGPVYSMVAYNDILYVGGQFTSTQNASARAGLNNIVSYNTATNSWQPLGSGLNGNVNSVVLYAIPTGSSSNDTVIAVSGDFTQILGNPTVEVPGFAIWLPAKGDWAERLGTGGPLVEGAVSAETASSNGTIFVAGAITGWDANQAQGIIGLSGSAVEGFALGSSSATSTTKRWLNSLDTTSNDIVVYAGAYYTGNNENITILGGHFSVSNATDVAFINGNNNDVVSGLPSGINSNGSVYALLVNGNRLYIGGEFTGTINNNPVQAIAFYDFSTSKFDTTQPPSLTGDGAVFVNTMASRPSNSQIVVGGQFSQAGSLPCPAICIYDTSNSQWLRPGSETIEGEVSEIVFEDTNTALVVGNISIGGNMTYVGRYNFQNSAWTSVNVGATGPVISVLSQDTNTLYLTGQNSTGLYFGKWNGQQFQDLTTGLDRSSVVTDIEFLPLSSNHADNSILSSDRIILLLGDIRVTGFGNASAVLYDGERYQPYILATKSDGSNGIIYGLFSQNTESFSSQGHIALGWVIVIALVISLFLIFLLVIGGIIAARIRRAREGYMPAPGTPPISETSLDRLPPDRLIGNLEDRRQGGFL